MNSNNNKNKLVESFLKKGEIQITIVYKKPTDGLLLSRAMIIAAPVVEQIVDLPDIIKAEIVRMIKELFSKADELK
ncbi:MAG: hypothetical protein WC444_05900 [Candidatus Paceibacterota bacterium]